MADIVPAQEQPRYYVQGAKIRIYLGGYELVPSSNVTDSSILLDLRIFLTLWDCDRCNRHQSVVLNCQRCHYEAVSAKAYRLRPGRAAAGEFAKIQYVVHDL